MQKMCQTEEVLLPVAATNKIKALNSVPVSLIMTCGSEFVNISAKAFTHIQRRRHTGNNKVRM